MTITFEELEGPRVGVSLRPGIDSMSASVSCVLVVNVDVVCAGGVEEVEVVPVVVTPVTPVEVAVDVEVGVR
jgi:hypothetical protein